MSTQEQMDTGVVVVGVDGSEPSKDALRWTLRYARMAGATVRVVTVWHYPASFNAIRLAGVATANPLVSAVKSGRTDP